MVTFDLKQHLAARTESVEAVLDRALSGTASRGETARPPRLVAAMRHGALNGGKRLRPILVWETASLFGRSDDGVVRAACALELIHCYSLVHDDLPAMDDDDLRRGQPTVHKAFDEATAILAGDALLTLAFDVIAEDAVHHDAAIRLRLSRDLARAAGVGGMAGGQMLDLESEHRPRTEADIRLLQSMKTGALLRYACRAGALLADAPTADVDRLTRFGEVIGLAFQLADDLLDVEASPEAAGKATGKDADAGKATLVGLWGVEKTRGELARLREEAAALLAPYGDRADILGALAGFIVSRTS
ncbi:polyprenyl synthetase family protein [Roseibium sp. AS2]|uniref:polyprenyl synthetase family protein n=1 Tax=Roseibium sp. AS2 TaxID=3135781 RepID=UPI00316B32F9